MYKPFANADSTFRLLEPVQRAPSVFNTQPWWFRILADDRLDVCARVGEGSAYQHFQEHGLGLRDADRRLFSVDVTQAHPGRDLDQPSRGHDRALGVAAGAAQAGHDPSLGPPGGPLGQGAADAVAQDGRQRGQHRLMRGFTRSDLRFDEGHVGELDVDDHFAWTRRRLLHLSRLEHPLRPELPYHHGTLYRRYGSKTELLQRLCILAMEQVLATADDALQADDPWTGLCGYIRTCVDLRSGALAALAGQIETTAEMRRTARRSMARIRDIVARAHADGSLRPDASAPDITWLIEQFSRRSPDPDPRRVRGRAQRPTPAGRHRPGRPALRPAAGTPRPPAQPRPLRGALVTEAEVPEGPNQDSERPGPRAPRPR